MGRNTVWMQRSHTMWTKPRLILKTQSYVCMCVYVHLPYHTWTSEDNVWETVLPHRVGHSWLGLGASALIH